MPIPALVAEPRRGRRQGCRDDRRGRPLSRRHPPRGVDAPPRRPPRCPRRPRRDPRCHRRRPRAGVRNRVAAQAKARTPRGRRRCARSSTSGCARGCGDCGARPTACRCSRSRRSSAARPRSTRRHATRTTRASTATARRSFAVTPGRGRRHPAPEIDAERIPAPVVRQQSWPIGVRMMGSVAPGSSRPPRFRRRRHQRWAPCPRPRPAGLFPQKAGAVVSDLRLHRVAFGGATSRAGWLRCPSRRRPPRSPPTPPNLAVTDPERTLGIVSTTKTPTGTMVADPDAAFPAVALRPHADRVTAESVFSTPAPSPRRSRRRPARQHRPPRRRDAARRLAHRTGTLEDALCRTSVAVAANIQKAFPVGSGRMPRILRDHPRCACRDGRDAGGDRGRAGGHAACGLVRDAGLPTDGDLGGLLARRTIYPSPTRTRAYAPLSGGDRRGPPARARRAARPTAGADRDGRAPPPCPWGRMPVMLCLDPALDAQVQPVRGRTWAERLPTHPPMLRALGLGHRSPCRPRSRGRPPDRRPRGSTRSTRSGRARNAASERALIDEYSGARPGDHRP